MPLDQDVFLDELTVRIRSMTRQTRLYEVLRNELTKKGYWRRQPRGDSKKGWAAMKAKAKQSA